jgi:hypothetical protein
VVEPTLVITVHGAHQPDAAHLHEEVRGEREVQGPAAVRLTCWGWGQCVLPAARSKVAAQSDRSESLEAVAKCSGRAARRAHGTCGKFAARACVAAMSEHAHTSEQRAAAVTLHT